MQLKEIVKTIEKKIENQEKLSSKEKKFFSDLKLITKYELFDYPYIIKYLTENNVTFSDNKYELIELAIIKNLKEILIYLLKRHPRALFTILKPGFKRNNLILPNPPLDRMAPLYLIEEKIKDDETLQIIFYFYPSLKKYYFNAYKNKIPLKLTNKLFNEK